ncbi:MAG: hypothetical protein KAH16_01115 [Candidatus Izimaplasma sp.]|nr:hypothetical protein [Candidatus Izimaplasma bacterium]
MNPFKKENQMMPIASLNSVYIEDILASDLFRPSLILEELVKYKDELGLTRISQDNKILYQFNNLLKSDLDSVKRKATEIAVKYGNRLAEVLLTLFRPSQISIDNRVNWTSKHWDFWQSITSIYLVGGLTSPILTNIFYDCVVSILEENNIKNLSITFIEGSSNLGTKGMSQLVKNGDYLLFDFGQTNIKRARHLKKDGKIVIDTVLPMIESKYLFYKTENIDEVKKISHQLDNYIIETILNTYNQVAFNSENIYLSIANYVFNGKIYFARGGYGKLAYIADNYEIHLANRLSRILGKRISVKLFHDTSAMALMFSNEPNTAVISLGTAFGIAFPE